MARELTQAPESLFWYWISERHAIFLKRQRKLPKPWTADPILRDYKFTNPFRENDRGTVWLRENFLTPHRDDLLWLIAANICWYRMFNWWRTGELLGWQVRWDPYVIKARLRAELAAGRQVFTGAHIVYSPPGEEKVDAITDVCKDLWRLCEGTFSDGSLAKRMVSVSALARETRSLEAVYNLLRTIHCVGGFMAYEMVTDMRHTRLLEDATDIMTWANPGPGALRGLQRLGYPSKTTYAAIQSMQFLLKRAHFERECFRLFPTEELIPTIGMPSPIFEMRDIEHSLCEFDKYCRVKFGEGEPRSRYPGAA